MSSTEHKQIVKKITHALEVAEREMLEGKARNNEDVIVERMVKSAERTQ